MVTKITGAMMMKNKLNSLLGFCIIALALGFTVPAYGQPTGLEMNYEQVLKSIKVINDGAQAYAQKQGLVVCLVDPKVAALQMQEGSETPSMNIASRMMWRMGNFFGGLFKTVTRQQKYKTLYNEEDGSVDAVVGPQVRDGLLTLCWLSPARLIALGVPAEQLSSNLHIIGDTQNHELMNILGNLGVVFSEISASGFKVDAELAPQAPEGTHVAQQEAVSVPVRIIMFPCPSTLQEPVAAPSAPEAKRSIQDTSSIMNKEFVQEFCKSIDAVVARAAQQKQAIETDAAFKEAVRLGRVVSLRKSDEFKSFNALFETIAGATSASFARWQQVMALAVSCFDLCAIGRGNLLGSFENVEQMARECKQEWLKMAVE